MYTNKNNYKRIDKNIPKSHMTKTSITIGRER